MPEDAAGQDVGADSQSIAAFVSYAHRDADRIREMLALAEARGRRLWIDSDGLPAGEPWRDELGTALEAADAFVCCLSPDWLRSVECSAEHERAVELGKRIIPVLIRVVPSLPDDLARLQYIDARSGTSADEVVKRLLSEIDTDIGQVREHTQWLTRALRWDRRGRDRSLLLRSGDLAEAEGWLQRGGPPRAVPLQTEYILLSRQADRRRRRRTRASAGLGAVALVAAVMVIAVTQNASTTSHRLAASRALASASQVQLTVDPERALLLALAAWKESSSPQALSALQAAYLTSRPVRALRGSGAGEWVLSSSSDGQLIVGAGNDGVLRSWDAVTGRLTATLKLGAEVATSSTDKSGRAGAMTLVNGTALVWKATAPTTVVRVLAWPAKYNALSAAISPDGQTIAIGLSSGGVEVFDVSGTRLASFAAEGTGHVSCLALAPDDRTIIEGTSTGSVRKFEFGGNSTVLTSFPSRLEKAGVSAGEIAYCSISPDGSLVEASTIGRAGRVVRLADGRLVLALSSVVDGVFDPDGRHLAAVDQYGVSLYDLFTRQRSVLQQPSGPFNEGADLAFSPDGEYLAETFFSGGHVWAVASRQLIENLEIAGQSLSAVTMLPGELGVAVASSAGVYIWSPPPAATSINLQFPATGGSSGAADSINYSPDGRTLIAVSDAWLTISNLRGGAPTTCPPVTACTRTTRSLYYELLISGLLSDLPSEHSDAVFDPTYHRIAVSSRLGAVTITDLSRPESPLLVVSPLNGGRASPVEAVTFSPAGTTLAVTYAETSASILNASNGQIEARLTSPGGPVTAVTYLPDGQVLTGDKNGTVVLWSSAGKLDEVVASLHAAISAIAFDPHAQVVAAGVGPDVVLVELHGGGITAILSGGAGNVDAVSYSSNGSFLASGGITGVVELWDTGKAVRAEAIPVGGAVNGLAFSPNGTQVAVASEEGSGWTFDCEICVSPATLVREASASLTRHLTTQEEFEFGVKNSP